MKFFKSVLLLGSTLFSHPTPAVEDDPELDHECTSWLVMRDLTGNNTNILHKNRDAHARDITLYLSPVDSPRKWIASGNGGSTTMGLNASGLAGVMNSGEKCLNPPDVKDKKGLRLYCRRFLNPATQRRRVLPNSKNCTRWEITLTETKAPPFFCLTATRDISAK